MTASLNTSVGGFRGASEGIHSEVKYAKQYQIYTQNGLAVA